MNHAFTADFLCDSHYTRRVLFAADQADAYRMANHMAQENKEHFCFASIRPLNGDFEPVVRSEWIAQDDTYTRFYCAHCRSRNHPMHYKRCPECGAHMLNPSRD